MIDEYQGRLYAENYQDIFDENGSVNVDIAWDFLAVPISQYFTNPGGLEAKDPEMYEFIRRNLK